MEILVETLVELLSAIIIPVTLLLGNAVVLLIQSIFYMVLYFRNLKNHHKNQFQESAEKSSQKKDQSLLESTLSSEDARSAEQIKTTESVSVAKSAITVKSVKSVDSKGKTEQQPTASTAPTVSVPVPPVTIKSKGRIFRRVMIWISGLALAVILFLSISLILANSFFFEDTVRLTLKYVQSRSGIAIDFENAEGNILRGRLKMRNVTVLRHQHPVHQMDLKAKEVFLDLSIADFRHRKFIFDKVNVSDMTGYWNQVGKGDKLKPRFQFRINDLEVDRARFAYRNYSRSSNALKTIIQIEQARIQPLRSGWAICDLLFRSNMRGAVDSSPFRIESQGKSNSFLMNDIPVKLATAVWGDPFEWFDKGTIDIHISNQYVDVPVTKPKDNRGESKLKFWKQRNNSQREISDSGQKQDLSPNDRDRIEKGDLRSDSGSKVPSDFSQAVSEKIPEENYQINGQWAIVIRDFHVSAPKETDLRIRTISAPLLIYLNSKSDRLGLNFSFCLDDENFEFSSSESIKETIRLIVGQKMIEQLQTIKPNGK